MLRLPRPNKRGSAQEVQTTMQDVMFTAEGLGKLLFIVGVLFFYATLFAVTRSSLFVWSATAIGAVSSVLL